MKKILFVLPGLGGGGAERVTISIAKQLTEEGFEVAIFVYKLHGSLLNDFPSNVKLYYGSLSEKPVKLIDPDNISIVWNLFKAMRNYNIVVGALELYATYFPFIINHILRRKFIAWVHIDLDEYLNRQPKWHRRAVNIIYPKIKRIVVPSEGVKTGLTLMGIDPDNVSVIYNPVDFNSIDKKILQETDLEDDNRDSTIIAVGRLEDQKNFKLLLDAFDVLISKGYNFNLKILGEGSQKISLKCHAESLDSKERIRFLGFKRNPYIHMYKAEIFALSSDYEGFGLVLAEAMYLNLKIVSTDCKYGPREILNDGEYGHLSPVGDVVLFAEALADASRQSIDDHQAQARLNHLSTYSVEKISTQWCILLGDANG